MFGCPGPGRRGAVLAGSATMKARHVQCPVCAAILKVPPSLADCFVRCGTCTHRFRLPRQISVTDEAIAEWLWQATPTKPVSGERAGERSGERSGDQAGDQADGRTGEGTGEGAGKGVPARPRPDDDAPASGNTAVLPALSGGIRLLRVNSKGATIEFPASRLKDPDFRCAMPRRCMRCGKRTNIEAHVVVFAPLMEDSFRYEMEKMGGGRDLPGPGSLWMAGRDILDALPHVPHVPPPADLPMPYWLCDLCTGEGQVAGQISVNAATGQGLCRLRVRNLRRAEEFLIAAGGGDIAEDPRFQQYIATHQDQPWDVLPGIVQQRLSDWYKPVKKERFVCYIADRDLPRADDGFAGVVVTNHRLVYHRDERCDEARVGERIRLQTTGSTGRVQLRIKTPNWDVRRIMVDREAVDCLRKALTAARFKAVWY